MNRIPNILGIGVVVASVLGCGSDPKQTDAGDEGETIGESEATSEGEATDGSETDGNETDGSETDGSETDGSETTSETTGGSEGLCAEYCQLELQCDPDADQAQCLDFCADEFAAAEGTGACEPALAEFYACVGGLSCAQFEVIFDDPQGPCFDEVVAFDELCSDTLACELSGGGDLEGSFCSYSYECHGSGLHRVECDAQTGCTCLIEDVEVGECDELYPALCDMDQADMQLELMNECCGWTLEL